MYARRRARSARRQRPRKRYGAIEALGGVDLEVRESEFVGLLGPNGAGKSTLVKIACGLVRPTTGRAEVCGARAGSREARAALGYLAELFRFPGWMTADELLELHQRLAGSRGGEQERGDLLELVGLQEARRRPRRSDVEGNAAAARDRAGARRLAAAAAARRADERARPGRPAAPCARCSRSCSGAVSPSCSTRTCSARSSSSATAS